MGCGFYCGPVDLAVYTSFERCWWVIWRAHHIVSLSPMPCGDFMISDLRLFATALAGMRIPVGV
jgi:hypothetical protein